MVTGLPSDDGLEIRRIERALRQAGDKMEVNCNLGPSSWELQPEIRPPLYGLSSSPPLSPSEKAASQEARQKKMYGPCRCGSGKKYKFCCKAKDERMRP